VIPRAKVVTARDRTKDEQAERVRRIQGLIAAAIDTPEGDQLAGIMKELRTALKDHIHRIRAMAAAKLRLGA
jgi:predicted ATPase